MLAIERYFSDNNHYNDKLIYGEQFAKAISWLFSAKKCGEEGKRFCLSEYTMPDVMSCILVFIAQAKNPLGQQNINDIIVKLKPELLSIRASCKIISHIGTDGKLILIFKDMDWGFIESVLWCAYMYWRFSTEENNELEIQARKSLYKALVENSGYRRDLFPKEHFLMKQVKPTMKIFIDELCKLEKQQEAKDEETADDRELSQWKGMVERLVKPFDDVMSPAGFYDMPMIKSLTRYGQCELILKLLHSSIPFKVALFHHIRFMDELQYKEKYGDQTPRLRLIEKALGLRIDNRELKGNFNVLKPDSNEDVTKYTSYKYEHEVKEFYDTLSKS